MNIFLTFKKRYDIQSYTYIKKYMKNSQRIKYENFNSRGLNVQYNALHYETFRWLEKRKLYDNIFITWLIYYFCKHGCYDIVKEFKNNKMFSRHSYLIKKYSSCLVSNNYYIYSLLIFKGNLLFLKMIKDMNHDIYPYYYGSDTHNVPKYIYKHFRKKTDIENMTINKYVKLI